jgi:hypothetical protein
VQDATALESAEQVYKLSLLMTDSSMLTDTASGNGLKRKAEHDEKRAGRSETASPVKADVEHGSTKKAKKSSAWASAPSLERC